MEYLYHGSKVAGIAELAACSPLHHSDAKVVYLSGSIPYALLYIWDEEKNHFSRKHVSGGIKDGIAFYEEQFPAQLETFYKGVSGFLYRVVKSGEFRLVPDREQMYYSVSNERVYDSIYVPDVYKALLQCEAEGKFKVLRYTEQSEEKQKELVDRIAEVIAKCSCFQEDPEQAEFMRRYFCRAWEKASNMR